MICILFGLLACGGADSSDQILAEKGLAIVTEAKARDTGWGDISASAEMVFMKNGQDTDLSRTFDLRALELVQGGDKSLVIIRNPLDVRGVVLLTHVSPGEKDNDIWYYNPSERRVRRIAAGVRRSPFVGSQFANEDFTPFEVDDFSYQYLRDENYAGRDCFVVEAVPTDRSSSYSKIVVWIDQVEYRIHQIEFYDRRRGTHIKTLTLTGYQQYLGRYWRPDVSVMEDHESNRSTRVRWSNYVFGNGFSEADFSSSTMDRLH